MELEAIRRSRRRPGWTQFDYLHMRRLVRDLEGALRQIPGPVRDVLDVYCGSRPYDDLFPSGAHVVGLDVLDNPYGVADVVSDEFLPFEDESFDLVTCIEAFHYVEDPQRGIAEMRRVLKPHGSVLISIPFVWEYNRTILERRYTGPELKALLDGWDDVEIIENGGRVVAWVTLTATLLERVRTRVPDAFGIGRVLRSLWAPLYALLNAVALGLDRLDERHSAGPMTLPMNLLVTARRPST